MRRHDENRVRPSGRIAVRPVRERRVSGRPFLFVAADGAPHPLAGVLFGVLAAAAASAVRVAFDVMLGDQAPFMMQIPSIVFATWLGGLWGGVAATITSAVGVDYLFIPPRHAFSLHTRDHFGGALLFVLVSLGLAWQVNRWRAAERALRLTRDRAAEQADELQALIDAVPAAVLVTRQPGQIALPANALGASLFGSAGDGSSTGQKLLRFESADGSSTIDAANLPVARAAARGVEVRDEEFSAIYDDGTIRTLFGHAVPLAGGRGGVRGAVGAFVDITERKRAETVLHQYELLARHTRDVVLFVRRRDGRLLEANAAAETAYGYTRQELLERTIFDLRQPEDAPITREQMAAADSGGVLFETQHRRRDGTPFPVEVSSRGMTLGGERVLLSVIRDITERARAEQSLRESESRMSTLLSGVTESIWLFDRNGRALLANATAAARLGRTVASVTGLTFDELLPPALVTSRRRRFDEVIETGEPVQFQDERAGMAFDHTLYPVRDAQGTVTGVASFSRDTTARRYAEAEIERLNVQLRTRVAELERLLALTPVGVAIAEDPECHVVRANAAMRHLLGQSADAELSMATAPRWRLRRDERDLPIEEWPFQRAAAQGVEIPPHECELTFDNGRVVNVLVSAAPLLHHDRSPGGCIGVMVDISDQKRIEAALVEQAERLQLQAALLENAYDAIIVRDTQGWITFWNRGAARLYGWAEDEALGRNVHELLSSDAATLDRVRGVLAAAGEWQGELQQRRKDGSPVVVDSRHATLDAGGAPDSILEINRDVSDRKKAEEQRAEMLARLAVLLEVSESLSAAATPEEIAEILLDKGMPGLGAYAGMVSVVSDDGRELEVLRSRGYSEQVRRAYARLPLAVSSPIADAISSGTTVLVIGWAEWDARYPSLAPALATSPSRAFAAVPLRGSRVLGAIGLSFHEPGSLSSRDSTFASLLARQAAQALERADLLVSERRAHAEAEGASRIKDDFLATLSHELRTPLNAILGWSHMMLADALSPESQRHAIEVIARNATTQVRLVDEVLDLSRIVRGQLRLDLRPVDVRAVIHRALDTARPAAAAKGLTLDVHLPDAVETIADADRLQQVVWNLLSNAVKFTPTGGRITISVKQKPAALDIEVCDTGIGITPAFLPHVFERFRQGDSSTTRHHGGLGLGLAIVRHIMELHGGTVSAQSGGAGAGSQFTITLPLRQTAPPSAPDAPETGKVPLETSDRSLLAGIRVLVVDDDADARDVLEAILAGAGAHVTLASSAGEAMELLSAKAPDLIVSDISMPGEDGYGFIRAVRALPEPHAILPAIAVTAYGHPADRATALAAGVDQHVAKPLTPRDLVAAVATLARTGTANADE